MLTTYPPSRSSHPAREVPIPADAVPVLIWSLTPQGEPSFVNRRLCDWMGIDPARTEREDRAALAREVCTAIHPEDEAEMMAALAHSLASGEPFSMRYRQLRKAGDFRWLECRMEPQRGQDGRILRWVGAAQDVEQEVRGREALGRTREQLAESTRVASLAAFAASIAHEVSQPLAAILADASACRRWLVAAMPDRARALAIAERMLVQAERGGVLVDRIRALFREGDERREAVRVDDLLRETGALLADEMRDRHIVLAIAGSATPAILVDRIQIQQLLINLVRNGAEASGGTGAARLELSAGAAEGSVWIEVRDHGGGVAEPERIFEPLFTTRPGGMGMGLAICRRIAEAHGGSIRAVAASPRGTRMILALPAHATEEAADAR